MADQNTITIPIDLPRDEAHAFAELLKRTSYEDCLRRSNRLKRYSDGREESDVMWSAVRLVEGKFAEAGRHTRHRHPGPDLCAHPGRRRALYRLPHARIGEDSPCAGAMLVTAWRLIYFSLRPDATAGCRNVGTLRKGHSDEQYHTLPARRAGASLHDRGHRAALARRRAQRRGNRDGGRIGAGSERPDFCRARRLARRPRGAWRRVRRRGR